MFAYTVAQFNKRILALSDVKIMLALAVLVWILRVAALGTYPPPEAYIHDEQANMLGAQTFAMGRLTNPPLRFPDSLREIHVLSEPTRMMKYQPATALFMAAGIKLFGQAHWGIVFAVSLMVAACYWAVRAWASKPIALAFSLLMVANFRAPHYWIDSYWGGAPIALACFLLLGAYAHIFIHKRYSAVWLGMMGVVLVAISRPLEGGLLILCLLITGALTFYMRFSAAERKKCLRAVWLPVLIIGSLYLGAQGYYNKIITGDALTLPYAAYESQNGVNAITLLNTPTTKNLSPHYGLAAVQKTELSLHKEYHFLSRLYKFAWAFFNIIDLNRLYFFPLIAICLLILIGCLFLLPVQSFFFLHKHHKNQRIYYAPLYLSWFVLILFFLINTWSHAHYLAPFFAVIVVIAACDSKHCWHHANLSLRIRKSAIISFLFVLSAILLSGGEKYFSNIPTHLKNKPLIKHQLIKIPDDDIVFIDLRQSYKKGQMDQSWVYNAPDIETAPIIWAWYLSPKENQPLIDHYKGRKLWYIEPDKMDHVIPYDDYLKSLK